MLRSPLAVLLAASVLAGCASSAASTVQSAAPTPSLPCSLPYDTHVALVSPVPGSSGVAAGNAPIVVVASRELPKAASVVVIDHKGRAAPAAALEKIAPPRAAAAPYADPVYYRAAAVALRAHKHYTVALDDLAQNGCAPYVAASGNARFST
jgi:hypothetical protein